MQKPGRLLPPLAPGRVKEPGFRYVLARPSHLWIGRSLVGTCHLGDRFTVRLAVPVSGPRCGLSLAAAYWVRSPATSITRLANRNEVPYRSIGTRFRFFRMPH